MKGKSGYGEGNLAARMLQKLEDNYNCRPAQYNDVILLHENCPEFDYFRKFYTREQLEHSGDTPTEAIGEQQYSLSDFRTWLKAAA